MKDNKYMMYICIHNNKNKSTEITFKWTDSSEKIADLFIISIDPVVWQNTLKCFGLVYQNNWYVEEEYLMV